jgi:hypothetical protein
MMPSAPAQRIIVAIDANTPARTQLQTAAEMASLLQAELHIVFLLNQQLKLLAELPFAVEISLPSRTVRKLCPKQMERDQLSRSRQARDEFERVLRQCSLRGSFTIIPELLDTPLVQRGNSGDIIWINRKQPIQLTPLTPRFKLTLYVVYQHSKAGKHTLALARRLRARGYRRVVVIACGEIDATTMENLKHDHIEVQQLHDGLEQLMSTIEDRSSNSLLIANDAALAEDREALLTTLANCRIEAFIVH